MSKAERLDGDLQPEYDFAAMKGGIRGKYVRRLRKTSTSVLLDPDVAAAFPTDVAVNAALRALMKKPPVSAHSRARTKKRSSRVART